MILESKTSDGSGVHGKNPFANLSQTGHLTVEEIPESQKCHKETNSPFRIKFLGAKTPFPCVEKADTMGNQLVMTEFENGNRLLPKIFLGDKTFSDLCCPWGDSLVIKLLGKHIGYSDEDSFEFFGNSRVVLT